MTLAEKERENRAKEIQDSIEKRKANSFLKPESEPEHDVRACGRRNGDLRNDVL